MHFHDSFRNDSILYEMGYKYIYIWLIMKNFEITEKISKSYFKM